MAFGLALKLAVLVPFEGQSPQGDPLIEPYPPTQDGGLTDDHPGAMINKECLADLRPGMNINPGYAVGVLGHDPGQNGHLKPVERVSYPINGNRPQAGVAENYFVKTGGGRVALVSGVDIAGQQGSQLRQVLNETEGLILTRLLAMSAGLTMTGAFMTDGVGNLLR